MIKIPGFIETLSNEDRSRLFTDRSEGDHYVYWLKRSDDSVFYVGKGLGKRIDDHEREARNGVQSPKCDVIRGEWANSGRIIKQKVAFFESEADAYRLEILLIAFFGRENLTNRTKGEEAFSIHDRPCTAKISVCYACGNPSVVTCYKKSCGHGIANFCPDCYVKKHCPDRQVSRYIHAKEYAAMKK